MSLFNPICTLFTRHLRRDVLRNEAPLHQVTPKYSRGKTGKNSEVTKKWNPKINRKKKKRGQNQNLSTKSILRPTAPSIPTRLVLHMCSLSQFVVVHRLRSKGK